MSWVLGSFANGEFTVNNTNYYCTATIYNSPNKWWAEAWVEDRHHDVFFSLVAESSRSIEALLEGLDDVNWPNKWWVSLAVLSGSLMSDGWIKKTKYHDTLANYRSLEVRIAMSASPELYDATRRMLSHLASRKVDDLKDGHIELILVLKEALKEVQGLNDILEKLVSRIISRQI